MLSSHIIRQTFYDYFDNKDHVHIPSSSVIPVNDPTLFFTNAGMNQFKNIILGTEKPKHKMVHNSQKCIRAGGKHNDLDDVGKDTYHHTFFEMLGNWSFGAYWKKEAIEYAWDLLVNVYKIDKDKIYVTYFEGNKELGLEEDLETKIIWRKYLSDNKILPFGSVDNFWEMNDIGPCGPCTEIHYDRIGNRDASNFVNKDDPNVIEIWNLVFMQFDRIGPSAFEPLKMKCVDTGMGFERLVSIIQNKNSNYDTDIFTPLFDIIEKYTTADKYSAKMEEEDLDQKDTAYRIVADHLRTLSISLADGGTIGAKGRDMVMRKIIRRGIFYSSEILGGSITFFEDVILLVLDYLSIHFPYLKDRKDLRIQIIKECALYKKTINKGVLRCNKRIIRYKKENRTEFDSDEVFKLYSTMGMPFELIKIMIHKNDMVIDIEKFEKNLEKHRNISLN